MRTALCLLAAALGTHPVSSQGEPFVFRPLAGEEFSARLLRVEDGVVHFRRAGEQPEQLELDLLAAMARPAPTTLGSGAPAALWLRSGAAFAAELAGADDAQGRFALRYADAPVPMPWRYVRAVCLDAGESRDEAFTNAVADPPEGTDLLFARRGEGVVRVSAEVVGFGADQVRVKVSGTERAMPLARVHGIVFGDYSGAAPDLQPNPRARVFAADGHQVEGTLVSVDGETWRVRIDEGAEFAIPDADVQRVRIASDRMVFLSDLEYELEQTAALDRVWQPLVDHGPGGGPIVVGGKAFARGLVLFPRTVMRFAIDGRFDALEATLGFDEGAGPGAHAVFRVVGDDRVLYDSGPFPRSRQATALHLPVTDVQQLTLEVDFGDGLDLGDVCAFAGARLVKW